MATEIVAALPNHLEALFSMHCSPDRTPGLPRPEAPLGPWDKAMPQQSLADGLTLLYPSRHEQSSPKHSNSAEASNLGRLER